MAASVTSDGNIVKTLSDRARTSIAIAAGADVHCKQYVAHPAIPDGRNPVLTKVRDIEVCIMDNLDANKEIWNAVAMHDGLGFQLEMSGFRAGELRTAAAAKEHLVPLFALFNP